VDGHDHP
jgi:hypothetical protein